MKFNKCHKEDIEKIEGIEKGTLFASKNGYQTEIKYSEEDGCYYGKIEGIDDLVDFEGYDYDSCLKSFYEAVDSYEELKKDIGLLCSSNVCANRLWRYTRKDEVDKWIKEGWKPKHS